MTLIRLCSVRKSTVKLMFSSKTSFSWSSQSLPWRKATSVEIRPTVGISCWLLANCCLVKAFRRLGFSMMAKLFLVPAILKVLVAELKIRLKSLKSGETVLKLRCLWPKRAKSWWISSEIRMTPCFWQSRPTFSNSSFVQTRPPGLWGLQKT